LEDFLCCEKTCRCFTFVTVHLCLGGLEAQRVKVLLVTKYHDCALQAVQGIPRTPGAQEVSNVRHSALKGCRLLGFLPLSL
jgi:hypothetical protein